MERTDKVKNLLNSIKLEVEDISSFEKDIESILGMFDELKEVDVDQVESTLNKKKIKISDLREDVAKDANFRAEMRGNYFKVPSVSKKQERN